MYTDRDSKEDKESLSQRALRLEDRNARAASASAMEGERKEDSRYDSNRRTFQSPSYIPYSDNAISAYTAEFALLDTADNCGSHCIRYNICDGNRCGHARRCPENS